MLTVKQILLENKAWWKFYERKSYIIRNGIKWTITKWLSCKLKLEAMQNTNALTKIATTQK